MSPAPTFTSVDQDGCISMCWCFGEPDAVDRSRLTILLDPEEGVSAFRVVHNQTGGTDILRGEAAIRLIAEHLPGDREEG